jgi:hypothetical protein
MFQRRHYRIVADIIASLALSDDEHDQAGLDDIELMRRAIAMQFADQLGRSNPNFNRSRFLRACQPQKKKPCVLATFTCPRCQKHTQAAAECEGLKCGDCLMNDCEVVSLTQVE